MFLLTVLSLTYLILIDGIMYVFVSPIIRYIYRMTFWKGQNSTEDNQQEQNDDKKEDQSDLQKPLNNIV